MPTISGRVIFDRNRSNTIDAGDSGMQNVPVVLQDTVSTKRLTVLTDLNGNYAFTNVTPGNYRVVEAYGISGPTVATPGNFTNAIPGSVPTGADPPIGYGTNIPPGATNLDSITPNTLFITVGGVDIGNLNFLDGPVKYTPISSILDPCVSVSPTNIITAADNGTFGVFPAGNPANTGAPGDVLNPPYPGVTPDFNYALPNPYTVTPIDGDYTIQNIMSDANLSGSYWWRVTAKSYPDETGRFMPINGANPGSIFFTNTVSVPPYTNYLFSAWIINLFLLEGWNEPALGVRILDQNGAPLYQQTLGSLIPVNTNEPEWKQIGTAINTQNNNQITVQFTSEGAAGGGNDYAIDEIMLQQINIPTFTPVKSVFPKYASTSTTITYTVTLANTCNNTITNVFFQDTLPSYLSFVPQSATGGNHPLTDNPITGFSIPNVGGNSIATVTFKAVTSSSIPSSNPINNQARMTYSYSPVIGGIENNFNVYSNTIPLTINWAKILMNKSADKYFTTCSDILKYTVSLTNTGNVTADNIIFKDSIPNGSQFVGNSFTVNGVTISGANLNTGVNVGNIAVGGTSTLTFKVQIVC